MNLEKITGNRALMLLLLFLILLGLCIYYYDNYQSYQQLPNTDSILNNYPEGKNISVSGTVTQTFSNGFYLKDSGDSQTVIYTVYSNAQISPGDKIQVLGILGSDYQITAKQIKVTEKWSYYFLLLRSFLAFLFLAFIFNRYWKFDFKEKVFIRRR